MLTGVLNATKDGSAVLVGSKEDYEIGAGSSEAFVARDAGSAGNNLRVVVADIVADSKMVKAGHGLSVGATLSDGATQMITKLQLLLMLTQLVLNMVLLVLYLVTDLHNLHLQILIGTLFLLDLLD